MQPILDAMTGAPAFIRNGRLDIPAMELSADTGLTMFAYTTEPGSKFEEALNLLASWTATPDQAEPADATDGA